MKRLFLALAASLGLCLPAKAITYTIDYTVGSSYYYDFDAASVGTGTIQLGGTITTNGATNRFLTAADILSWSLSVTAKGVTRTINSAMQGAFTTINGSNLYAGATDLRAIGYRSGNVQLGVSGMSPSFWISTAGSVPHIAARSGDVSPTGQFSNAAFGMTNIPGSIAFFAQVPPPPPPTPNAVPLPASAGLLGIAFMALGLSRVRRKRADASIA